MAGNMVCVLKITSWFTTSVSFSNTRDEVFTFYLISSLQSLINEHMEDLSGLKMTDEEKKGYLTVLSSLKKKGKTLIK